MNQLRSLFFQLYQRKIENTFFSLIQHGGIEAFLQIRNERRVLDDPMDFDHIYARHNALERTVAIFVLQVCLTDHMPQDEDLQSLPVYLAMRRYRNAHVFCGNDS